MTTPLDDQILAASSSGRNQLLFSLGQFEGLKTLDIRKWYRDRKTSELRPTRKGITLTAASFETLKVVLEEHGDRIRDWLQNAETVAGQVSRDRQRESEQRRAAAFSVVPFQTERSAWRSPVFFEVLAEGGLDRLLINARHPLVARWSELLDDLDESNTEQAAAVNALFETLLVSLGRAVRLFGDDPSARVLVDSLLVNWGLVLQRYVDALPRGTGR